MCELQISLQEMQQSKFLNSEARGFYWVHCGDIDPLCQKVLLAFDSEHAPCHVTADLNPRLPLAIQTTLHQVEPVANGDPEHFEMQYETMCAVLSETEAARGCFSDDTLSYCLVHKTECQIYKTDKGTEKLCGLTVGWAGTSCLYVFFIGIRLV